MVHWLSLQIVLFNCFDSIYKAIGYLLQREDPLSSARHLTQEIRNLSNTRKNSQHPVIRYFEVKFVYSEKWTQIEKKIIHP